jgi:lactam utilization protein B
MSVNKINFNSDLAERDFSFYQSVDLPLIAQINSANIGVFIMGE